MSYRRDKLFLGLLFAVLLAAGHGLWGVAPRTISVTVENTVYVGAQTSPVTLTGRAMDGDGLTDLLVSDDGVYWLYRSTGNGFNRVGSGTLRENGHNGDTDAMKILDFDADGHGVRRRRHPRNP